MKANNKSVANDTLNNQVGTEMHDSRAFNTFRKDYRNETSGSEAVSQEQHLAEFFKAIGSHFQVHITEEGRVVS